jgi:hypothetical protein
MKTQNSFKLSAYASLAGFFLGMIPSVKSQVIYTDIDPDIIVNDPGVNIELDLDQNGTFDFSFLHSSFVFYSPGHNSYRLRIDMLASPLNTLNAIAGSYDYHGTFSGGYWWYYPYALNFNSKIDANTSWQTSSQQILALVTIDSDDSFVHYTPDADWFNSVVDETIDHFLGVRFIDVENLTHYGWIRCDVIDSGKTLVIKDYAYNDTPNDGIYAGTLITSTQEALNSDWNVYAYNNKLCINLGNSNVTATELNLYNINGTLVMSTNLHQPNTVLSLQEFESGLYIVEIKNELYRFTEKLFIH